MSKADVNLEYMKAYTAWSEAKSDLEELTELLKQGTITEDRVLMLKESFTSIDEQFRFFSHIMLELNKPQSNKKVKTSDIYNSDTYKAYEKLGIAGDNIDLENLSMFKLFKSEVAKLKKELKESA